MATKKTPAKKTTKKAAKKAPAKKAATKKTTATKKAATKKTTATKKAAAKKKVATKKSTKSAPAKKAPASNVLKKASVARSNATVAGDKKATPIMFSLDDVEALVASRKKEKKEKESNSAEVKKTVATAKKKVVEVEEKPTEKRVLGAASLADILGFNPAEKKKPTTLEESSIPKKWTKFYKLLLELRQHVQDELDLHTADTLKHSSREDSGDLANYSNHQADAATDTFDRDFALSLVSSEQDALNEIEEAIQRMKDGTYGICEVSGKAINKERLAAVPFARYSIEGQKEYEKNNRRKVDRSVGGIFSDTSDAPKISSDDDED